MSEEQDAPDFLLLGNRLWLDLVNTEIVSAGERVDLLASYADVVRWARLSGAFTADEADRAAEAWSGSTEGERALDAVRAFRATLRAMAERMADGGDATDAEVDAINAVLRERPGSVQVERDGGAFVERWHAPLARPEDVLSPVALSAARSLAHDDRALLRRCENPRCILLFYDVTRNHGRRWCSMETCGNRAKVAAFHQRRRAAR